MIGDNGRLQYLRFCLFEMYVSVLFCHKIFVQRSEFNSGYRTALYKNELLLVVVLLLLLLLLIQLVLDNILFAFDRVESVGP